MRVAIVRQRYTPYGGAERFVARALPALQSAGAEVSLLARRWEGWPEGRVIKIDPPYIGNLWRDTSFARAARRTWRSEGFDIVQSHERIPGCDVYRAGDGVHRRWLDIRMASASRAERIGIRLNPYHRYVCAAEKKMFEHSGLRAVICNSRMVLEEIRTAFRIDPGKLHLIYNGIDLEKFHPEQQQILRVPARAGLGLEDRDAAFLFVGSGYARKGLSTVFEALSRIDNPSVKLLVAGRDRRAGEYARLAARLGIAPRVRMLGERGDVAPLYAAADCFILPTRYDPFPNTVLEAMAMGLPAIVSRRCGAAEIIESGENGWLCEPDAPDELANLIGHAAHLSGREKQGMAARRTAERFGIDDMARQLMDLYSKLDAAGKQ